MQTHELAWESNASEAMRTSPALSSLRQPYVADADASEPDGKQGSGSAARRQLLAAASPPFTVSPAQSGVRIDSPELRMNGAPTQLFQIDFGKATVELNPINLFTITGAVECAAMLALALLYPCLHLPKLLAL